MTPHPLQRMLLLWTVSTLALTRFHCLLHTCFQRAYFSSDAHHICICSGRTESLCKCFGFVTCVVRRRSAVFVVWTRVLEPVRGNSFRGREYSYFVWPYDRSTPFTVGGSKAVSSIVCATHCFAHDPLLLLVPPVLWSVVGAPMCLSHTV